MAAPSSGIFKQSTPHPRNATFAKTPIPSSMCWIILPFLLIRGRYTWRHDSILSHIVLTISKLIPKEKFTIYADIPGYKTNGGTIPPNILPTSLKPDIVIVNNTEKSVHIFELTVPFETNINSAHERKISKYLTLRRQNGYNNAF